MAALTLAWVSPSPLQLQKQDGGQEEYTPSVGTEEATPARTNLPDLFTTKGPPESPPHPKPSFIQDLWTKMMLGSVLQVHFETITK